MANRTQIRLTQVSGSLAMGTSNAFEISSRATENKTISLMKFDTRAFDPYHTGSVIIGDDVEFHISGSAVVGTQGAFYFQADGPNGANISGILQELSGSVYNSATDRLGERLITAGAVKSYVDATNTSSDLDFQLDGQSAQSVALASQTLHMVSGRGIDLAGSGQTIEISAEIGNAGSAFGSAGSSSITANGSTIDSPSALDESTGQIQFASARSSELDSDIGSDGEITGKRLIFGDGSNTFTYDVLSKSGVTLTVEFVTKSGGSSLSASGLSSIQKAENSGHNNNRGAVFADFNDFTVTADGMISAKKTITSAGHFVKTAASIADDDFLRVDGTVVEGRSASEVLADIGAQPLDAQLTDVAGLTPSDGGFIVGDGNNFTLETGPTARTSLGLGAAAILGVGVGNNDLLQATSGISDNDFLKVDGSVVEGRSAAEVLSDIQALPLAGGTLTGALTLSGAPSSNLHAATKAYVDSSIQGLSVKNSVRVATTGNGTLSSAYAQGETVDGITLAQGDRILIKDQTSGAENGIYTVNSAGAPTRATDFDASTEIDKAPFFFVEEGTVNANAGFVLTTDGSVSIGSTSLAFAQFSGAGAVTAGNGLDKSGNTLSLDLKANGGLVIDSTEVTVDLGASGITGTLAVGDGGTGATTLTDGGILLGSGTGAVTAMAVLADGSIVVGDGSGDPVALAAFSSSTGTLKVANGGTGASSLDDIVAGSNKLTVSGGADTVIGGNVSIDVAPGNIQVNDLSASGGALAVAKGGTGATSLDDIVVSSGIGGLTVSGGTDTVIGGNVTLGLSSALEAIHDNNDTFASNSNVPMFATAVVLHQKTGSSTSEVVKMNQLRQTTVISATTDIVEITPANVQGSGSGFVTLQSSAPSSEDSVGIVKVFVNGQLLREARNTGTIANNNSTTANPAVGALGDYTLFRKGSASDTSVYDDGGEGNAIKFGFNLEQGDIVQVMAFI